MVCVLSDTIVALFKRIKYVGTGENGSVSSSSLHHHHCHKSFSQMTCLVWDVNMINMIQIIYLHLKCTHSFNKLWFLFIVMLMEWRRRIKEEEHDVWHACCTSSCWQHMIMMMRIQMDINFYLLVGYNNETIFFHRLDQTSVFSIFWVCVKNI